jgi:hypothetical protein
VINDLSGCVWSLGLCGNSRPWPQPSAARIEKQVLVTLPANSHAGNVR